MMRSCSHSVHSCLVVVGSSVSSLFYSIAKAALTSFLWYFARLCWSYGCPVYGISNHSECARGEGNFEAAFSRMWARRTILGLRKDHELHTIVEYTSTFMESALCLEMSTIMLETYCQRSVVLTVFKFQMIFKSS